MRKAYATTWVWLILFQLPPYAQGVSVNEDSSIVSETLRLLENKQFADGVKVCTDNLPKFGGNLYLKYLCAKHLLYVPVINKEESHKNFGVALTLLSDSAEKLGMNVRNREIYRDAMFHMGMIRQLTGYGKLAIGHYKKVVQYEPRYAPAWYNMAAIYEANGNHIEANRAWLSYLDSIREKTDDF